MFYSSAIRVNANLLPACGVSPMARARLMWTPRLSLTLCSTSSPRPSSASGCYSPMTLCQGNKHFSIYRGLTNDALTALPTLKASGLMGSLKMVPSASVTMMKVLSFDDYYNVTGIGCDETFSIPFEATNERWPQYKRFAKCSGLSC